MSLLRPGGRTSTDWRQHRAASRLTFEPLEPRQLLAGNVYLFNFQPEASFVPNRFLVDSGEVYGLRGDGLTYGWTANESGSAFERSLQPDQRLDTGIAIGTDSVWELALPNGNYEVTLSVGDPSSATTNTVGVEGQVVFADESALANEFRTATANVTVADGRLSIDAIGSASGSTRLNYLYVIGKPSGSNQQPDSALIQEPTFAGQIVNPSDVHMEAVGYVDSDGDSHVNSDWEIWTTDSAGTPLDLAWTTIGIAGVEKYHTHLGDGIFVNTHAGRGDLQHSTGYAMRVRFRDSAGAVGEWASRPFTTGSATEAFPLELEDVAATPAPTWKDELANNIVLEPASTVPHLKLESPEGDELLTIAASNGIINNVTNPPAVDDHVAIRVSLFGGSAGLQLGPSDLVIYDDDASKREIYLPEVDLGIGQFLYLWVASDGSTYYANPEQTQPDFSNLARSSILGFVALEPGFRVEVAAEGLQLPVNIAFVPNPGTDPNDPQFYVTELYGQVKVVLNNGDVLDYATDLLNYNPTGNFPGSGEQGVAGIVVDPGTGDVFITRAADADGVEGGPHHGQVVRLHSTDEGRSSTGETIVLDMVGETQGQSHQISDISIGPDGKLYVHNGDGFDSSTALNLNSFRGKILRMNLDGTPAVDNPYYDAGDGLTATDYIYAYGFRNPFGGDWRAADGMLYEVENGPGSDDRFARVEAGANYGWNGSAASMQTNAIYNWTAPHAPVDIAFVQPETFGGSQYPLAYQDVAFVTESGPTWAAGPQERGKRIVTFEVDANGNLTSGPTPFVEYQGQGRATAAGITAGPDGLYFSDLYPDTNMQDPTAAGARILRVRYVGVAGGSANFEADVRAGLNDLDVQFTDTSTVGGATSWQWQFGDGATSTEQNPLHTYTTPGVYDVQLTVVGEDGARTLVRSDYIVAGYLPTDTNQDGVVEESQDVQNFINGWLSNTSGMTTQQALFAGDNNLDGLVDSSDAFRLRRALFDAANQPVSTPSVTYPPGDFNHDLVVDQLDYSVWKADFGLTLEDAVELRSDANGDGVVDLADYTVWRNHLGVTLQAVQVAAAFSVPGASEVSTSDAALTAGDEQQLTPQPFRDVARNRFEPRPPRDANGEAVDARANIGPVLWRIDQQDGRLQRKEARWLYRTANDADRSHSIEAFDLAFGELEEHEIRTLNGRRHEAR